MANHGHALQEKAEHTLIARLLNCVVYWMLVCAGGPAALHALAYFAFVLVGHIFHFASGHSSLLFPAVTFAVVRGRRKPKLPSIPRF